MQFLSSRPTTPLPLRPQRSNTATLSPGDGLDSIRREMNGAPPAGPDVEKGSGVVGKLEEIAAAGSANGSAK